MQNDGSKTVARGHLSSHSTHIKGYHFWKHIIPSKSHYNRLDTT